MSRRTITFGIIGVVVVIVAAAVLLRLSLSQLGKTLAEEKLPGLSLGSLDVGWNRINITDFRYVSKGAVQTRLTAQSVEARPSFLSFLGNEVEVSKLNVFQPDFHLVRMPEREPTTTSGRQTGQQTSEDESGMAAAIKRITIRDGKGDIEDRTLDGPPARVTLEDIQLNLEDVKYPPQPGAVYVDGSAVIKGQPDGHVSLSGWIDRVDQSADLKIRITSLDLRHLHPYLRRRMRTLETATGKADIQVNLVMNSGVYDATGEVTITDLNLLREEGEGQGFAADLLRQYVKLQGNRVSAPFEIKGNLRTNQYRVDFGAILAGILTPQVGIEALQKRFGTPANLPGNLDQLEGAAKGLKGLFK
jgi:hypothetical protein